jgi:signal transduction histidine kinase
MLHLLRFLFVCAVLSSVVTFVVRADNSTAESAPAPLIQAYVGDSVTPHSGSEITIPYGTPQIRFFVTLQNSFVTYQLEGFDLTPIERAGQMYFGIRFFDAGGDQIDEISYWANRQSSGWKTTLEDSTFTQRNETIKVPANADHLGVFISSAGPPSSEGIIAVTNISIARRTGAVDGENILYSSDSLLSDKRSTVNEPSPTWVAGGTHPSMATIAHLTGPSGPFRALQINDDDLKGHADWSTIPAQGPHVKPGDILELHWKEAFSTSEADPFWANYDQLAPGNYRFKIVRVNLSGAPMETLGSMVVHVSLPYWKNPWYWTAFVIGMAAVIILGSWFFFQANVNRQLGRNRLIEEERMRIARDIHDTLAQGFTGIIAQLQAAKNTSALGGPTAHLERAESLARSSLEEARRSIRALRPTSLQGTTLTMAIETMVKMRAKDSSLETAFTCEGEQHALPLEWEEALLRIVQESLTNSIRHSHAKNFRSVLRFTKGGIDLKLADDGRGFNPEEDHEGFGLIGMKERVKRMGGTFAVHSDLGHGTEIIVTLRELAWPKSWISLLLGKKKS